MAARNSDYWKRRMAALGDEQFRRSEAYYNDVQEQYRRALNNLQQDIERWYWRLADNNEISYVGAKKLLKKNELEEFRWTVEEYIKAGKENALDQRWMKELENASAKYHISRLEAMKLQLQQHAELLSTEFEGGMTEFLQKSYGEQFYRTAYEIAKGTGIGSNLAQLDTRKIDKLLKTPWARDGANFSDRIWSNKEKLVNNLHTELTQMIIRGEDPRKTIDRLAKTMNVSKNQAGNLIMTESAAISSAAQRDCFQELDVEEFEVVETFDDRTCEICQAMDGKHFPMSAYEVGVTAPPFHPRCRGCTCPYFDDEFSGGERSARDPETGKTVYVDSKMTYPEWKKTFVDNGEQMTLKGLSANEKNNSGVPIHDSPAILGEVDFSDKDMIISTIKEHESRITESPIENAVVVTRQGKVVQCFGDLNGVYPDADLGSELQGAFVTHNHPRGSDNEYSFSDLDIQLFMEQKLEVLRGIDEKYIYELTRNSADIDEYTSLFELTEEDGRHEQVIEIAHQYGIGYRRWRR